MPSLTPPTSNTLPITNVSGYVSQNTTWVGGRVYLLAGPVTINPGVTLTINSGAVVKFQTRQNFIRVEGSLVAQGTPQNKIYFTSYKDDSIGGDNNGDGNASTPATGDFIGLINYGGGTINLENVVIRYGGYLWCGVFGCSSYPSGASIINLGGSTNATSTTIIDNRIGITSSGGVINFVNSTVASSTLSGIEGVNSVDLTIKNSTITQSGDIGVKAYGNYGIPVKLSISNSTISENGSYGVHAYGSQNIAIDATITDTNFVNNTEGDAVISGQSIINFINHGNTTAGTTKSGFHIGGPLITNHTWNPGVPFIIDGRIDVPTNSTLTINPGTIVKFVDGQFASLYVLGSLVANGTSGVPIYFTSLKDDSVGGDSNGDGSITTPSAGDYPGIHIAGGADISNVVIKYGGADYCHWGSCSARGGISHYGTIPINISLSTFINNRYGVYSQGSATTTISNTSITNSTYSGVIAINPYGGPIGLSIEKSVITKSGHYGVYVIGQSGDHNISITNTSFSNNQFGDGNFGSGYQTQIDFVNSGNRTSGTSTNGFYLYGSAKENQTWNPGVPFIVGSFSTGSKSLTINPGTVVKFQADSSSLWVGGAFVAQGKKQNKIYFTSYKDDFIGGDSNGDGYGSYPAREDYVGIVLYGNSTSTISNAVLRYGGKCYAQFFCSILGVVSMNNGQGTLNIDSSAIYQNGYGINKAAGNTGNMSITKSDIAENLRYGLNAGNGSNVVARDNWWGDTSGPRHTNNPGGTGDQIYGNAVFSPWLLNCNFSGCVSS